LPSIVTSFFGRKRRSSRVGDTVTGLEYTFGEGEQPIRAKKVL